MGVGVLGDGGQWQAVLAQALAVSTTARHETLHAVAHGRGAAAAHVGDAATLRSVARELLLVCARERARDGGSDGRNHWAGSSASGCTRSLGA